MLDDRTSHATLGNFVLVVIASPRNESGAIQLDGLGALLCSSLRSRLAAAAANRLHPGMLTTVVITIFGPDRPGLVEAVAARVAGNGGNWLESRLLHLGGHFAGIVRVEVDESRLGELLIALRAGDGPELRIVVHDTRTATETASAARTTAALEVIGHDRPGIVRAISRVLAERGVNVEELATERGSAPMSGEPIFQARAKIALPSGIDSAKLRGDLEKIAADLMVEVKLVAAH